MSAKQDGPMLLLPWIRDAVLTARHIAVVPRRRPMHYVGTPPRAALLH